MKVGTILYTRDGRKIGNAIILEERDCHFQIYNSLFANKQYKIKTDFGNVTWMTDYEISRFFHIYSPYFSHRYPSNIKRWMLAKAKLFFKF
jgi:hypothetical protein